MSSKAKPKKLLGPGDRFTVRVPEGMLEGGLRSAQVTRMLARHVALLAAEPAEQLFSPKELKMAWDCLSGWITDPPELIFTIAPLTAQRSGKASAEFLRRLENLKASELLVLAYWIDGQRGGRTK